MSATGSNLKWYSTSTGGTALATSTALSTGNYYVSQTTNGCESARTMVAVTVNTTPGAPTATTPQTFCSADNPTVASLTATGSNLKWYTTSTGGTALATTTALATGNYYVSQTTNGCESARTTVAVTVNTTPNAPTANDITANYDGNAKTATATASGGASVVYYTASTGGSITTAPSGTNAGTYTAWAESSLNGCVSTTRTLVTLTIGKAATTTVVTITGDPFTYTGAAIEPATVSVTGAGGLNLTPAAVYADNVNAGTATASYSYAGDANYLASTDSKTFTIGKAATTTVVTITGDPFTYTGAAIEPATVSVTGAGGLNLTPAASYVDNVNAGTATASYSYAGDANYLASTDSKTFTIGKAATTTVVTITGDPFTYTGAAIEPATVSVTGAGGLNLTPAAVYADNVNAGTATASYSYAGDANYLASTDSKTFTIGKAATTTVVTITGDPFTYTGAAIEPATVSVTGAGGLNLTPAAVYANNVNAGTATASYSYPGDANYLASTDSKTFTIGKAATTTVVTITGDPFTYTGAAIEPATVSVTGAGGLNLTPAAVYADNVNAGTATASYSYAGDANYLASTDSKTFTIGKAATTTVVTITGDPFTYTGAAIEPATVSVTGAGGLNLTPAASYADNVNAGTATASYSYAGDANYLASTDSKTFTIGKAATTTVVTITGDPFTYTGAAIEPATVSVTGAGGLNLTPAASYADNVNAGTATASYSYAGDANYLASTDSKTFTIGKAATTTVVTITGDPFTYTGAAIEPATVSVTGAGGLNLTPAAVYADNVNAGTATASYSYAGDANYLASTDSKTFTIGKAATTTVVTITGDPFTYTGAAIEPATVSVTGAGGLNLTPAASYVDNVNAGTATASYSYAGDANYLASTDSKTFTIGKAATTTVVTITGDPFTYTGAAIEPATVSVTGAGGLNLTPAAVYADNVNAGTATASYSYAGDANYLASTDSKTFTIGKAATTTVVTITGDPFTYTGAAIEPATVSVTGAGGLNLTPAAVYANNVNAGTATASYSYPGDANYLASTDSKTFTIGKAATTTVVTITGDPFTYTGAAIEPATVSVTGAGGLNLTPAAVYADNVNAGTATASYSYAGDANYLASTDSKTFTIGKAATTTVVTITGDPFTYTGAAIEPATVSVTGAGGLNLTPAAVYANNVNAGTATASYSYAGDANYLASTDSKTFTIGKAATTTVVTITGDPFTYTGAAIEPATVSVTGAGGLNLTPAAVYANNVNAGTATASYSYAGDANYLASTDSKTFTIGKAATVTTVTINGGPFTYTGAAITPATVSVTGAGGLNLTPAAVYADNVNAGTATASYSYAGDANYLASTDSKTFTIGKAATTTVVTINGGPFTYTGAAITPATVSVTGAGGLNLTPAAVYANNVNAGTATASYSYAGDANYLASTDSKTFTIGKAATVTTVTINGGPFTYTGSAITPATVTVTGAGGLNLTPAAVYANNVNAGTATASYSYAGDANYLASTDSKTFTIGKAATTTVVTITGDPFTYTGAAIEPATVSVTGAGGLNLTPAAVYADNVNAGTATASYSYAGDANYLASTDSKTFTIGKAATVTTVTINGGPFTYTGSAITPATVTVTGAGGLNLTPAAVYADNVNAGTATASYSYAGDANYLASSDSKTFTIGKAATTTVVTINGGPFTYTGAAITPATVSVTGAGGLNLTPAAVYANNVNAGTATASYSYPGDANYLASTDSKTFTIGKAATVTTVTINGGPFTYTGSAITPATVTVTGAGGLNLTPAASYVDNVNAGTATASYNYAESANYLASTDSKTFTIGKATITIVVANKSKVYGDANPTLTGTFTGAVAGDGITVSYSTTATAASPVGDYPIIATLSDPNSKLSNYNVSNTQGTLTINKATLTVTADNKAVQYSDIPTFTATITGYVNGDNASVLQGTLTFTTSATLSGIGAVMSPAGEYTITPAGLTASNYTISFVNGKLTVTKENSELNYSGAEFFSTSSSTSSSATIALSATITDRDDTPTGARGDIRNAKVDITGVSGGTGLNVGLVNPGILTVGSATLSNINITLSGAEQSAGGTVLEITMKASGNYYTSDEVDQLLTISVPGSDFVTGGGNLVIDGTSAGTYAATNGSKMNFGFTMKNNKSGKNLQGQATTIFRRYETVNGVTGWFAYKIKSNAINSLATTASTTHRKAIISTKANLTRTYPDGTVESLGGNLDLTLEAWEAISGNGHNIAVTLREPSKGSSGGGVLFSSSWLGSNTVTRVITGGNIRVSNGSSTARESFEAEPTPALRMNVDVVASPNPVSDQLRVIVTEAGMQPSVRMNLYGMDQRLYGTYTVPVQEGRAEQTIDVKGLQEGMYIIAVDGAHGRVTRKVLKTN